MEIDLVVAAIGIVYTIPLGWLFVLNSRNTDRMDEMQKHTFTKTETNEMIELHNRPVLQAVASLKEDIKDIKQMIGKLFDGQAKG